MSCRPSSLVLGGLAILAALLILTIMPISRDELWIDPITGSTLRQTVWLGSLRTQRSTQSTAIESWLLRHDCPWQPDWRFLAADIRGLWGNRIAIADGSSGSILMLPAEQEDLVRLSTEDEMRSFVEILRTGTHEQKTAAVGIALKRVAHRRPH